MLKDNVIVMGMNDKGEYAGLLPQMANRHGLIAGATGTGKTVTLKVMAESFSDLGVPVLIVDVKGDVAGIKDPGTPSEDMNARIEKFKIGDSFEYRGYPVTYWDVYGEKGIQLRTTVSEMGPLLMSKILQQNATKSTFNDLQKDLLTIAFKIADERSMLLVDTKDLKAVLNWMGENRNDLVEEYGRITEASISSIIRSIVALEAEGGDKLFGEPACNVYDWLNPDASGKGMINILHGEKLVNDPRVFSAFLLWMMAEFFENMPEVGDVEKPKLVFLIDEAHLLFDDSPKIFLEKIEQAVKLIRSKGIGVYFSTHNPRDIPDGVLNQLGNKIEHGLHAYTPAEQKVVRAVADAFRVNPDFDTYEAIQSLGTGEAVVSFIQEDGTPGIAQKVAILPPQSRFGTIDDAGRDQVIKSSMLYSKYAVETDPDSAYEFLERWNLQKAQEEEAAAQAEAEAKEAEKQAEKEEIEAEKALAKEQREKERLQKNVGKSVAGTVGREVGKTIGGTFGGKVGKTIGGNLGATIGRGLLETFFKK
jgi:DNA helicase HerA-like ATPase